jgi:UDP-3-O-[3-hydroxymyristoyl] glucosamine N-acyltransferase
VEITLQELADLVHGTVHGDGSLPIRAARSLQEAAEGDITYVDNDRNLEKLHASAAAAAVVDPKVVPNGKPLIQCKDPLAAFVMIVQHLHGRPEPAACGIDPRAYVHPSATVGSDPSVYPMAYVGEGTVIGDRCRIHPGAVIGRFCKLGNDVTIFPNAVLYDGTEIGDRSIIHSGAVIGADGFGYRFQNGRHVKVPQLGSVVIGTDVEIGACTTIDRGTFQATRIGDGSKIDNLVQIAHNCRIGKHNVFAGQVGIAGSCSTGDYVVMAGKVGISDHVNIGAGSLIGAQSGVNKDVPAGQRIFGAPAKPESEQKRIVATMDRLPEMRRDLTAIKRKLGITEHE